MSHRDVHWQERLFAHRLIFVMGKGGVGKSTLSVLLAMTASRLQKKVLLVEFPDNEAIGKLFDQGALPEAPLQLSDRVWGARVNPKAELEAYIRAHVNPGFIANRITQSRLFDYLFAATPGLKEVMSLGRIWRWEKSADENRKPAYDLIIVDSPATGHGLSLLRLPMQLIHMIRVGPIVSQIQELQGALQERGKTSLVLVTLPEELPVNEALEFYHAAEADLNIPVEVLFVNGVWPAAYTDREIAWLDSLKGFRDSGVLEDELQILADAARRHIHRRMLQQKYIDQINALARCPSVEVPFYFTNDLSLTDISEISLTIMPQARQSSEPSNV